MLCGFICNKRDLWLVAKVAIMSRFVNPIKVKSKYAYSLNICYLSVYIRCLLRKINIYSADSSGLSA